MPNPIFPPRPLGKMDWRHLPRYEASGEWVAQRKFNGKHVVVWISPPTGEVGIWGREKEPLVTFRPTPAHYQQFLSLNINPQWTYWLAGELLHRKTTEPYYQNRIILFDVLQAGRMLINRPDQMGRLSLLADICRHPQKRESRHGIALAVSENIWMAETFEADFLQHFKEAKDIDEIEGLVLRKRRSSLTSRGTVYYEVPWLVRCRKPKDKVYEF